MRTAGYNNRVMLNEVFSGGNVLEWKCFNVYHFVSCMRTVQCRNMVGKNHMF